MSVKKTESAKKPESVAAKARTPLPAPLPSDANMELTELRLPLNPANPRDVEVTVGLNGRFWKIQRGHNVQVPKAVAEILANSERQTAAAMVLMNEAAN